MSEKDKTKHFLDQDFSQSRIEDGQPPVWNLTTLYSGLDDPTFRKDKEKLKQQTSALSPSGSGLAVVLLQLEEIRILFDHLRCYLGAHSALNPTRSEVLVELDQLKQVKNQIDKAENAFLVHLRSLSGNDFLDLQKNPKLQGLEFYLDLAREQAAQRMNLDLENLATDLDQDGAIAWEEYYNKFISTLHFEVEIQGEKKAIPMGQRRTWLEDNNPEIRKKVFHASNAVYQKNYLGFEAALNGIVGARLSKLKHRPQNHFLAQSFLDNRISQASVDAVIEACRQINPALQKYMQSKEVAMDRPFGFYDLEGAGVDPSQIRFSWLEAWSMIEKSFQVYPKLLNFAKYMLRDGRIEARPSPTKSPGGYCDGSPKNKKAYIYQTFGGSIGDTLTLAHELGHAFHHFIACDLRPFHKIEPMTLAETASTFCEALMNQTLLQSPHTSSALRSRLERSEKDRACAFLVDIPTRFEFEKSFHIERLKGFVPAQKISELMLQTQKNWWGRWIPESELDPCFWMSKGHFYMARGTEFYNYPYSVGYLLSRILFKKFREDPTGFSPIYESFLKSTGQMTVEQIVKKFLEGNTGSPEFWLQGVPSEFRS